MAPSKRNKADGNSEREIKPSKSIFFVNDTLVRLISSNRGANIVYLFDIVNQKEIVMLYEDYKKHRKRAYLIKDACALLGRTHSQFQLYAKQGLIKPPVAATAGGIPVFKTRSYYSEDDIFKIREAMSTVHKGRPRKDGKITNNNVLTEQELRAKMGDALMLYTRTKDGEYIPVWSEQTY